MLFDPSTRIARVGPGCTLADIDQRTQEHGLAATFGFVSATGVAGLTVGGGFGYLSRRFGWTVDDLEEVEIVTADGAVHRASRSVREDLFWALRGGGGNFGIVTAFQTVDESDDRTVESYRGNYDRLAQVKARYDPGNLFRVNRNIRP